MKDLVRDLANAEGCAAFPWPKILESATESIIRAIRVGPELETYGGDGPIGRPASPGSARAWLWRRAERLDRGGIDGQEHLSAALLRLPRARRAVPGPADDEGRPALPRLGVDADDFREKIWLVSRWLGLGRCRRRPPPADARAGQHARGRHRQPHRQPRGHAGRLGRHPGRRRPGRPVHDLRVRGDGPGGGARPAATDDARAARPRHRRRDEDRRRAAQGPWRLAEGGVDAQPVEPDPRPRRAHLEASRGRLDAHQDQPGPSTWSRSAWRSCIAPTSSDSGPSAEEEVAPLKEKMPAWRNSCSSRSKPVVR
jgi:hypothetical protein